MLFRTGQNTIENAVGDEEKYQKLPSTATRTGSITQSGRPSSARPAGKSAGTGGGTDCIKGLNYI
jgi:hypothetical protein